MKATVGETVSSLDVLLKPYLSDIQDNYPDDAGLISIGIHYQIDTLGSRLIATK